MRTRRNLGERYTTTPSSVEHKPETSPEFARNGADLMRLSKKLARLDAKVDEVLMHPTSPAFPNADRLEITYPGEGAVWSPAEEVDVTWKLIGDVQEPLDVSLVRQAGDQSGANYGQLAFITLATGVDPAKKKVTIEVPDVPPGDDYAISISSADPLTAYSHAVTITEPA